MTTPTDEIRAAANRIQSRAPRRAELNAVLEKGSATEALKSTVAAELVLIDAMDAADGRVLASTGAIIDGSRPERLVHRALKNLMNEWGLTKASVLAEAVKSLKIEVADAKTVVEQWMNGAHMREYVGKIARDTVKALAEPLLKQEVRAFLDRRIKLTATIAPEEPT